MTPEQRRRLGAYYTPEFVTNTLCSWAIKKSTDTVLEPSFGGCNFLTSSLTILRKLGNKNPEINIFGFDIDTAAFQILSIKGINTNNFLLQDFLYSNNEINKILVDVVIGNPPYLPIHKLDSDYKQNLYNNFKKNVIKVPKRSSLWVYFIVHSFQYLRPGGRMAWVVPDSIAFTYYGKHLLKELTNVFASVQILRTDERYFNNEGTHEKTAFLLCSGYQGQSEKAEVFEYNTLAEVLEATLSNSTKKSILRKIKRKKLLPGFEVRKLGDVFTTRIGIVIGATKLLAFKKREAFNSLYYPDFLYPMITKGKQLNNLIIDRKEILKIENLPNYLLNAVKMEKDAPVMYDNFIKNFPPDVLLNQTFSNRQSLFGYDDFNHPDAFLTYFSQGLPKLIINNNKELNCTNSVHRLYLNKEFVGKPWVMKFISIQLYCEFMKNEIIQIARQYGNKIKKYEPSDAQKIPVFIPLFDNDLFVEELNETFQKMVEKIVKDKALEANTIGTTYLKNISISFTSNTGIDYHYVP